MIYQKLINKLISEQVPQMHLLAIQLSEFYESIPNEDLQEDMGEILFGFGDAVESTEGAYKELLEMEREGEDITEQLNLVLGASQRVIATKIDMIDYLLEKGLENYDLSHKKETHFRAASLIIKEALVSKKQDIEYLANQNSLSLEVSQELLETAWAEVGKEKLEEVIDGLYMLIDEVIGYSQENEITANSLNEYLDLRNQVKKVAEKLSEEINPDKLQELLMHLMKLVSQLQIQQLLDLQLQIDAQLAIGKLFSDKKILVGLIDEIQEIHGQIGALLDTLEQIIMPSFLEDEEGF